MPNRIIKESIRASKSVNAMTDFQFRLWIYLITYVDDYGLGSADPELLKGLVFPRLKKLRESDIADALAGLERLGSIQLYTVAGEPYLAFPNWGEHQRIQSKKSKFPSPDNENIVNSPSSTVTHRESPLHARVGLDSDSSFNPLLLVPSLPGDKGYGEKGEIIIRFDEFWASYPKKRSKGDAIKAWERIKPDEDLFATIMLAVSAAKESDDWRKEGGKYIPFPASWLRAKGWEDEYDVQVPDRKTGKDYILDIARGVEVVE